MAGVNQESEYVYAETLNSAVTLGQYFSSLQSGQTFMAKITASSDITVEQTPMSVSNATAGKTVIAAHVNGFVFNAENSIVPASTSATTTQPSSLPSIAVIAPISTLTTVIPTQKAGVLTAIATAEPLSFRAKIGIGVGVSIGVICIICLIATIILLRRRSDHWHPPATELSGTPTLSKSMLPMGFSFFRRQTSVPNPHSEQVYEVPGASKQMIKQPQEM